MTTTINYKGKDYQINLDSRDWFNNKTDKIIKLPTGELLRLNPKANNLVLKEIEEGWVEAKEIYKESL